MAENESRTDPIRKVAVAQSFIKEKYSDTIGLATSILGQVLLGTLKGSKRKKEVIKLCLKDMKNEFSDRVAEDPRSEIDFMRHICNCNHPNFVRFIDAVEDNKLYCMCIEYVIGGDMCTYIQNIGTGIDDTRAKKYFTQLTKAVYFMHKHGYCHLDISLENVLWDKRNDIVKLCDFGLSRKFPSGDINEYFPSATIRPGKKGYMAPEIYAYQKFNGEKADVFSLGVIIFILLTGFPPFNTPNASDKCFQYMYYGKLEWLLKQWKLNDIISPQCRDLLSKIFCHTKKRITIKEMLIHPYLNQNINDIDNEITKYTNSNENTNTNTNTNSNENTNTNSITAPPMTKILIVSKIGKKKRKSISKPNNIKKVNNIRRVRRPKSNSIAHINLENLSIHESSTLLSEFAGASTSLQQSNVNYVINVDDNKNKYKNKNNCKKRSKSLCYSYDNNNISTTNEFKLSNIQIVNHINNKWMSNVNVTQIKNHNKPKQLESINRQHKQQHKPIQTISNTNIQTHTQCERSERSHSHSHSHSEHSHSSSDDHKSQQTQIANLRQCLNETQLITQKYSNSNGNFTPNTNDKHENEYDNDRKEGDYETYPDPITINNIQQERRFSVNESDAGSINSINTNSENDKSQSAEPAYATATENIKNNKKSNNQNTTKSNRPSIDE